MLLMHRNISRLSRNATGEEMVHKQTANDAESSSTTASQCHWCPGLQRTGPTSVTQCNSEHVQQVESTPRYHHLPWKKHKKNTNPLHFSPKFETVIEIWWYLIVLSVYKYFSQLLLLICKHGTGLGSSCCCGLVGSKSKLMVHGARHGDKNHE